MGQDDGRDATSGLLTRWAAELAPQLVALRRELHEHPELGRSETRTTATLTELLERVGLAPQTLPEMTGLVCDVLGDPRGPVVALRADLDALPVPDLKQVPYRSRVTGVCHACGHDAHTACVYGAAVLLARLAAEGALPGIVRVVLQPAEELMPGGALDVLAARVLDGVDRIFAVHCDPRLDVGLVGVRAGPVSAAADYLSVTLTGTGGHTARPHLTGDLVFALAKVATELPAVLSRRVDPRAGLSVVWGTISAGNAANAIPRSGELGGTVRALDSDAWHSAPELVTRTVERIISPYDVEVAVRYTRGVPPVVNEARSAELLAAAARSVVGSSAVVSVEQSLGGEDFAWYLHTVPGALARLGVRRPGDAVPHDLHQGDFDVDERALPIGASVLAAAAFAALEEPTARAARLAHHASPSRP